MANNYNLQYYDVNGILHELGIQKVGLIGTPIEINGYCELKASSVKTADSIYKGLGLEINLQADTTQTFSEFFESDERTYKVTYEIDGVIEFVGWIEPDGYYESFVESVWFINITCVDGLSYLENLSYVQSNGLIWTGRQKALDIIINCLDRLELNLYINTSIQIHYTGLSTGLNVLDNIYINSERYYRDDGETIMSCSDVLKDLLQIFGASIVQRKGEWFIYKINSLFLSRTQTFHHYQPDGTPETQEIVPLGIEIGSEVNDFPHFHCNENQKIGLRKAGKKLRIYYKYGFLIDLIPNPDLVSDGIGGMPGWTILQPTIVNVDGVDATLEVLADNDTTLDALEINPLVDVQQGDTLKLSIDSRTRNYWFSRQHYTIILEPTGGGTDWHLNLALEWTEGGTPEKIPFDIFDTLTTTEINFPPAPVDGDIKIIIVRQALNLGTPSPIADWDILFYRIALTVSNQNVDGLKGEVWNFENEDIVTSKIRENIEIFNGDSESDIFYGNIYKTDQDTNTSIWCRIVNGVSQAEDLPIIHLLGEDLMRLVQGNSRVFEGDFKGYVPYFSIIEIDGLDGYFTFLEYSHDSRNDIVKAKMIRFYGDDIANLDVETYLDYGNTVKPTIVG